MNARGIALEMIQSLPDPEKAKGMLGSYSDDQLEKAMATKWGAIDFVASLGQPIITGPKRL